MPLSRGIIFIRRNKLVDKLVPGGSVGDELLEGIKGLLQSGSFAKAEQQLLDVVAVEPDHEEGLYMLAVCQRYLKKYSAALSNLDRLKGLVADHSRGHQ